MMNISKLMINRPKISVIIPVFNTENYIEECLDSVLSQSLAEIEVLIMDDGSTDNSNKILSDFAKQDLRIKLFKQNNSGQSVARNVLIEKATGEYIYFMDSDDILRRDALESCYNLAKKEYLDIVTFDADIFYEENQNQLSYNYHRRGLISTGPINGADFFQITVNNRSYRAAPWLLFVKRDLLYRSGIRFFPGIIHEDELFTPQLYIAANKVSYIPERFFSRRVRSSSTMTNVFSEKNFVSYITVVSELGKFSNSLYKSNRDAIRKIMREILSVVANNSNSLNLEMRCCLMRLILREKMTSAIPLKSLMILSMPFIKRINSGLRKIQ